MNRSPAFHRSFAQQRKLDNGGLIAGHVVRGAKQAIVTSGPKLSVGNMLAGNGSFIAGARCKWGDNVR